MHTVRQQEPFETHTKTQVGRHPGRQWDCHGPSWIGGRLRRDGASCREQRPTALGSGRGTASISLYFAGTDSQWTDRMKRAYALGVWYLHGLMSVVGDREIRDLGGWGVSTKKTERDATLQVRHAFRFGFPLRPACRMCRWRCTSAAAQPGAHEARRSIEQSRARQHLICAWSAKVACQVSTNPAQGPRPFCVCVRVRRD